MPITGARRGSRISKRGAAGADGASESDIQDQSGAGIKAGLSDRGRRTARAVVHHPLDPWEWGSVTPSRSFRGASGHDRMQARLQREALDEPAAEETVAADDEDAKGFGRRKGVHR